MLSFHQVVKADFESVNQLIIDQLHSDVDLVENIGHYIVDSGGKRLRPLLVLLIAKALGYQGKNHLDLAVIIEFIHTATLLHDDVVDISSMRRGKPTANAKWGNAPSVLVGDFLYSRSFQMMVSVGEMDIMKILSDTTNVISEGEVQQLINARNPDITEEDYYTVIHKKTAALFEAACSSAASLAGANEETVSIAIQYGYHLGLAFQLIDDALDYEGEAEALGKNVGDDLAEGKTTLPLIHAMKTGSEEEATVIRDAIKQGGLENLTQILDIVGNRDGLKYTKEKALWHAQQAQAAVESFPDTEFKRALVDLAIFSVERNH